jgi:hypothetical protein
MSKAESYDWVDVEDVSTTLFTEEPTLSIYRDASGHINGRADYSWFADTDGFVRRADPDQGVLGFVPRDGDDVRLINRDGDEYGGTVGLQKALKILGIDAEELDGTYHAELEAHDGIVVADLSDLTDTATDTRTDSSDRAMDGTTSDADASEVEQSQQYKCDSCDYVFDTEDARDSHAAEMHGQVTTPDDEDQPSDTEIWCGVCGAGPFETTTRLAGHHNGSKHGGQTVVLDHEPTEAELVESDESDDHGGTEVPDPEDVPSHETVRDCADGVDTVQELADLLDVDATEARFLARDADVYADLRDNPPRPGVDR